MMSVDKEIAVLASACKDAPDPEALHRANPPVLRPEGDAVSQNPVVVDIRRAGIDGRKYIVCVFPEKRDEFRDLVKPIGFRWAAPKWQMPVDGRVPDPDAFCAALAHQLLGEGYMVQIKPYGAHRLALTETYDPLPTLWCERSVSREFRDWFRFTWPYEDESSYSRCRTLPGSRYADGAIYVPKGSAPVVLDFCERQGFALTADARALAAEQEVALENSLVLNIRKRQPKAQPGRPTAPTVIDRDLSDE